MQKSMSLAEMKSYVRTDLKEQWNGIVQNRVVVIYIHIWKEGEKREKIKKERQKEIENSVKTSSVDVMQLVYTIITAIYFPPKSPN